MADVGVYVKNADIQARAGANANSTAKATAETDKYVLDVESFINSITRYNWSDNYAALNVDVKYLLKEVGACICAMYVINYDMSGYTSRLEAQTMLDFLRDRVVKGMDALSQQTVRDFMTGA